MIFNNINNKKRFNKNLKLRNYLIEKIKKISLKLKIKI